MKDEKMKKKVLSDEDLEAVSGGRRYKSGPEWKKVEPEIETGRPTATLIQPEIVVETGRPVPTLKE